MVISEVVVQALAAFKFVLDRENREKPEKEQRHGGYLCLIDPDAGHQVREENPALLLIQLGEPPWNKRGRYASLAQEKAWRLAINPSHKSSWQSRQEKDGRYGGAVRVGKLILSFSGFTEHGDEAVVLITAAAIGWISSEQAREIATISGNKVYPTR